MPATPTGRIASNDDASCDWRPSAGMVWPNADCNDAREAVSSWEIKRIVAGSSNGSKRCRAAAAVIGNAVFASCVAAPVKADVCAYKLIYKNTYYKTKCWVIPSEILEIIPRKLSE